MITKVLFAWTPEDQSIKFVTESINRLSAFIAWDGESKTFEKGPDGPALKSLSRVMTNNEFSESDIRTLAEFLTNLAARAKSKYDAAPLSDAPWKPSVLQAAENGVTSANDLLRIFYELIPNLKPIAAPPEIPAEPAKSPPAPTPPTQTPPTPNPTPEKP